MQSKTGPKPKSGVMTAAEYRSEHEISVRILPGGGKPAIEPSVAGEEVTDPVQDFASAPFSPQLLKELKGAGFLAPSPIQAQCWPYLTAQRDLVAIAQTGSGKTCG